jgi:hypothetical protein
VIRYAPSEPMPATAYVPGHTPRPREKPRSARLDPADWQACTLYLHGVDLYNHGFPWEAHEAWEVLWLRAPEASNERLLLQALIKLAAARVKQLQGQPKGVQAHSEGARALLGRIDAAMLLGLDLRALAIASLDAPLILSLQTTQGC